MHTMKQLENAINALMVQLITQQTNYVVLE